MTPKPQGPPLAPYASQEDYHDDLDEIVTSKPYRRLSNKSQVMVKPTRDHFRSRLIHTTEVNQIAVEIGHQLRLNTDLISAMAMAHDIGHTPFAHAGERTLQEILLKELVATFECSEKRLQPRRVFHHASNSARMLLTKFDVQRAVAAGTLTHSWSPWRSSPLPIPTTYEGQVAAIADQLASINHDTEDIIEGEPYTNYNYDRFYKEAHKWITAHAQPTSAIDQKLGIFLHLTAPGYGRRTRIRKMVEVVVEAGSQHFDRQQIMSAAQALEAPLQIPDDWADFLNLYERFIREAIVQRESWFVGRDAIAKALVSTVFNHIWPRFKTGDATQMDLWPKSTLTKSKIEEELRSIEHYEQFYSGAYNDDLDTLLAKTRKSGIETWDVYLVASIRKEIVRKKEDAIKRLISVIDFVAGLTDRYCLEIFDRVYQNFSI